MSCQECGNEQGVTVLHQIKADREFLELKYNGGIGTKDGRVLCWWCAFPDVGIHL